MAETGRYESNFPSESELFSGVYQDPSKSLSESRQGKLGRFPNSVETDFG
jgi:hypothetical protein